MLWLLLLLMGLIFLLLSSPVILASIIIGISFLNPVLPPLVEIGDLSFRFSDILIMILFLGTFARAAFKPDYRISNEFKDIFFPIMLFLLYVGATLLKVYFTVPHLISFSATSFFRLVFTFLYGILLYKSIKNMRDMVILYRGLIVMFIASIAIFIWLEPMKFNIEDFLNKRYGVFLNVNTLGLISGLLVLFAFVRLRIRLALGVILLVIGIIGLILSKSASSIFATAVAIAMQTWLSSNKKSSAKTIIFALTAILLVVVGYLLITILRPTDVAGLRDMSGGSFAQRAMLYYAGMTIFFHNPIIGIGWQTSNIYYEQILGNILINKFYNLPHNYLSNTALTPHNLYIQLFMELGIIGFMLFVYACFRVGKAVAVIVRRSLESPDKVWALSYTLGLILLLVWWNTNALYGGQVETNIMFTFIAALAKLGFMNKHKINSKKLWTESPQQPRL